MHIIFMINYSFSLCNFFVDSKTFLVINFINLKIKLTQSFRGAYIDRMCICVFIGMSAHTHKSIYICTYFNK
jgi:hypothetical protein